MPLKISPLPQLNRTIYLVANDTSFSFIISKILKDISDKNLIILHYTLRTLEGK